MGPGPEQTFLQRHFSRWPNGHVKRCSTSPSSERCKRDSASPPRGRPESGRQVEAVLARGRGSRPSRSALGTPVAWLRAWGAALGTSRTASPRLPMLHASAHTLRLEVACPHKPQRVRAQRVTHSGQGVDTTLMSPRRNGSTKHALLTRRDTVHHEEKRGTNTCTTRTPEASREVHDLTGGYALHDSTCVTCPSAFFQEGHLLFWGSVLPEGILATHTAWSAGHRPGPLQDPHLCPEG